jgi:hypothetical protein
LLDLGGDISGNGLLIARAAPSQACSRRIPVKLKKYAIKAMRFVINIVTLT